MNETRMPQAAVLLKPSAAGAPGAEGRPVPANTSASVTAATGADHSQGGEHAAVLLLEYGDYECPACRQAEPVVRQLLQRFKGRLRFVYRHFPLFEVHPHAQLAAEAAEAAAAQGQFWPMHRLLMTERRQLDAAGLAAGAESLGLDMLRYQAEMADRVYTQRIQEHRRAGEHSGVHTTPAFFVNGKAIDVTAGFAALEAAIDAALLDVR